MTADIINLARARKAKEKEKAAKAAAANRARFGRTKAQKAVEAKEQELTVRRLDFSKRTPADEPPAKPPGQE